MPMGIVSDSEFNKELDNLNPSSSEQSKTVESGEIHDINRGRGQGTPNVPDGLRKIIGEESATNGRQSAIELASQFGISASSVSAYDVGATSTSTYNDRPNGNFIDSAKHRVSKRARGKLMLALSKITDERLDETKARDLAGIARDMSVVIKNMEPEKSSAMPTGNSGPTFVFYSPQMKKEEVYDVVHVKE